MSRRCTDRKGGKRAWLPALLLAALLAGGCRPARAPKPNSKPPRFVPSAVNGERALADVRDFVALGPRVSGTPGAASAARYLATRLTGLGIDPIVDEFTEETQGKPVRFRNVIGVIPGNSDRTIILASHYDTKSGISPDFAGANDSGSSTGLLLELGRVLTDAPPRGPEILLVFLDGEECRHEYARHDGLHGSRHLARTLIQNKRSGHIAAVIVIDMIGDKDLTVTLPRNSTRRLAMLVLDAAAKEGVRDKFGLAKPPGMIIDDHTPFVAGGMPAVDIIDFEFGSAPGKNDYWHTPEDTMDKLSAESLQSVGRVVVRVLNELI
jgi:glutaminyl-peptide cyclotransferase